MTERPPELLLIDWLLKVYRAGGDIYPSDIEEKLLELGIFEEYSATGPCGHPTDCVCSQVVGFPALCSRAAEKYR